MLSEAAHSYLNAGLCVLPAILAQKRPAIGAWKRYQDRLPTEAELSAWMSNPQDAICVLCGAVSNQMEIIDFDGHGELFLAWLDRVPKELANRLVIESTPSGGMHVIYCNAAPISGNLKLAQRKTDATEGKIVTLIETRGQGGLFLCAPTLGYELVQGDMTKLPLLTAEERDILLQAAWELNEYVPPVVDVAHLQNTTYGTASLEQPAYPSEHGDRPGDDFNKRGDPRHVLTQHGWSLAKLGENEYWRRPGKEGSWSASLKDGVFYVFSANAAPFESHRAYSPFAVYTLLEHGGDYAQAASALRMQGYGQDETTTTPTDIPGTGVDISGIVGGTSSAPEQTPADALVDPGPMPLEMLQIPGFVNEVMDHCLATAPYPNPVMAFCGALSLQAFLAGRKVRDSGDNRTNLYLLGLAHSSAGKDWPRKINTRILHEAGLADALGERFASGEGIQDALFQTPAMIFQTDEIDGMLQSINKAKDARHEAIMSTLLTMYSSANSVFPMRRKAGKECPGVINQPCLVIFGTAIPNHYYEALSERMLTNGFFARMIILEAGQRGSGQEPSICELPQQVIQTAHWWAHHRPGTGNLQDWNPIPTIIEHTCEARQMLVDTREEAEAEYARAEARSDPVGTTVWGRVSEQTRKLALLYAISENHESPSIGIEAVRWASRFVMHQTRRMLFMAQTHVAEGEFDGLIKRAVEILRQWREKNGQNALMPAWELRRRLKQRPGDFKDIVLELDARQIAVFDTERAVTKPNSGYRLL